MPITACSLVTLLGCVLCALATSVMQRPSRFDNITGPQGDQRYHFDGAVDSFAALDATSNGKVNIGYFGVYFCDATYPLLTDLFNPPFHSQLVSTFSVSFKCGIDPVTGVSMIGTFSHRILWPIPLRTFFMHSPTVMLHLVLSH